MSGTGARFEPYDRNVARHDKLHAVYEKIYPSLRHLFPELTEALEP